MGLAERFHFGEKSGLSTRQETRGYLPTLERIQRGWNDLWAAIDRLTPAQMQTPDEGGWSIKDNLVHLTAWERYMLLHYLQGRPAAEAMGLDEATMRGHFDQVNAALFQRNRDRPLADVLADAGATHGQVVDYLAQAPFETLMRPLVDDDAEKRPVLAWVAGDTFEHYEEHLAAIHALDLRKHKLSVLCPDLDTLVA